ncbi:MAG: AI-2E family transporter [Acidimicrobiales bacterium]|nr:AI-2E family transporter [Acidimicrobiales bacterium]
MAEPDPTPDAPTPDAPTYPPQWLVRSILLFLGGLAALWYLQGVLESLRSLFIILLVALFLSFAMEPAVNALERWNIRRGLGTALVFLTLFAGLGGFGFAMGSLLSEQVIELSDNLPGYLESIDEFLADNLGIDNATADVRASWDSGALAERLSGFADDLAKFGATVANVLFQVFTIGLFAFYLVAEGPKLRRTVCSLLPQERQRSVLEVWDVAIAKTGGYIVSRGILAVIAAVVHWAAFEIIDLPSGLALAIWVGVISQVVPVVGTYLAGALPVLIGLIDEPASGLWVLIVIAVYQQVENYLLAPRITSQTMAIHPAVAFGAVIAGAALLGVVGAMLALPAAATLQAIISAAAERHEVAEHLLEASRERRKLKG